MNIIIFLHSTLSDILNSGLSIIADDCSINNQNSQIEFRIAPLTNAIKKMQGIIAAYQMHEVI